MKIKSLGKEHDNTIERKRLHKRMERMEPSFFAAGLGLSIKRDIKRPFCSILTRVW